MWTGIVGGQQSHGPGAQGTVVGLDFGAMSPGTSRGTLFDNTSLAGRTPGLPCTPRQGMGCNPKEAWPQADHDRVITRSQPGTGAPEGGLRGHRWAWSLQRGQQTLACMSSRELSCRPEAAGARLRPHRGRDVLIPSHDQNKTFMSSMCPAAGPLPPSVHPAPFKPSPSLGTSRFNAAPGWRVAVCLESETDPGVACSWLHLGTETVLGALRAPGEQNQRCSCHFHIIFLVQTCLFPLLRAPAQGLLLEKLPPAHSSHVLRPPPGPKSSAAPPSGDIEAGSPSQTWRGHPLGPVSAAVCGMVSGSWVTSEFVTTWPEEMQGPGTGHPHLPTQPFQVLSPTLHTASPTFSPLPQDRSPGSCQRLGGVC